MAKDTEAVLGLVVVGGLVALFLASRRADRASADPGDGNGSGQFRYPVGTRFEFIDADGERVGFWTVVENTFSPLGEVIVGYQTDSGAGIFHRSEEDMFRVEAGLIHPVGLFDVRVVRPGSASLRSGRRARMRQDPSAAELEEIDVAISRGTRLSARRGLRG